jgi:hypothetical protein
MNNEHQTARFARSTFGIGTLAAMTALSACHGADQSREGQDKAAWGALNDASLLPDSPQYLMNKKQGEAFRVCLPNYMAEMYPGIEEEIPAAINVWASALGRSIPVEIEKRDLPRSRADQDVDALAQEYEQACGDGFDVVLGLARLDGPAVGLTGASYSYYPRQDGTQQINSFARFLFVRDYDVAPDTNNDGPAPAWMSLSARTGKAWNKDEILETMNARSTTMFASDHQFLILPVLTHEFGHVWGLCDQYEGSTNCDPQNSTSHLVLDSIMGAHGGTERLFLTDDDVDGVRALGARPGFQHDWPAAPSDPEPAIATKPVELARIEHVVNANGTLSVTYGIVTDRTAKYAFSLKAEGESHWTPLENSYESRGPIDEPTARLDISLGENDGSRYRVRLVVTPVGDIGLQASGTHGAAGASTTTVEKDQD